jgi:PAS domain S-box-containing protein
MRIDTALRESQERFSKAFSSGPLVFTLSSLNDGRLVEVNDTFVEVTGYSRAEAIGKTSVELGLWVSSKDRDEEMAAVRELGQVRNLEYEFRTRDGNQIIGLLSAERIEIGGQPFALTVIQDITDRKRSQEALIKAERKAADEYQALMSRIVPLAATLGRSRDLISIYRSLREFICVSMRCSGFFVSFFDPETSLRHAAYVWGEGEEIDTDELPPMRLDPESGGANSRAVFEKRTIITNNYWDEMKDRPHVIIRENGIDPESSLIAPMMIKDTVLGTLEVQAHENEAFDQEHGIALEMAANLAAVAIENVRLIDTEAAAREAAESANRAKDEFLSVLSHELRTPLNAMLGWVRMLKAGVLDEENAARALEVIERNTRLQSSLIEDLLDVSRIISGKMRIETELVDLVSVVETVSETIQPLAAAKDVTYRFVRDEDSVFLTADSVRLQQVVSNLLQNSIKFTPAGGSIEISLRRNGSNAELRVQDTGVGIERDLLPHIFDRFRQADASARRNFTGLGLGLTIVRNIVELHGGSIDVQSDGKDLGSAFIVTLPLAEEFYSALDTSDAPSLASKGSLAGKTILLVDDDRENLMPLKLFLETEMADVTPASSAMEALEFLAERDFHLMITDIGMPEIDGYELVARLRSNGDARNAALKAIALTAYASVDDRERALRAGFHAHLSKPVNFEELLAAIERVSRNGG